MCFNITYTDLGRAALNACTTALTECVSTVTNRVTELASNCLPTVPFIPESAPVLVATQGFSTADVAPPRYSPFGPISEIIPPSKVKIVSEPEPVQVEKPDDQFQKICKFAFLLSIGALLIVGLTYALTHEFEGISLTSQWESALIALPSIAAVLRFIVMPLYEELKSLLEPTTSQIAHETQITNMMTIDLTSTELSALIKKAVSIENTTLPTVSVDSIPMKKDGPDEAKVRKFIEFQMNYFKGIISGEVVVKSNAVSIPSTNPLDNGIYLDENGDQQPPREGKKRLLGAEGMIVTNNRSTVEEYVKTLDLLEYMLKTSILKNLLQKYMPLKGSYECIAWFWEGSPRLGKAGFYEGLADSLVLASKQPNFKAELGVFCQRLGLENQKVHNHLKAIEDNKSKAAKEALVIYLIENGHR